MKLNTEQLKALSGITADAGQVFFAATVVPFVFGLDRLNLFVLLSGLALTIFCWITSLVFVKGIKK